MNGLASLIVRRWGRAKLEKNGGSLPPTLVWRTEHDDNDMEVLLFVVFKKCQPSLQPSSTVKANDLKSRREIISKWKKSYLATVACFLDIFDVSVVDESIKTAPCPSIRLNFPGEVTNEKPWDLHTFGWIFGKSSSYHRRIYSEYFLYRENTNFVYPRRKQ